MLYRLNVLISVQLGRVKSFTTFWYTLVYGALTLTKRIEKKLDSNYTRMLRAILNKSWRQHPTKQQLCGHLQPITKTIKVRQTRHAGHCWRSRDELIRAVLIRNVTLKTCQGQWTIGRGQGYPCWWCDVMMMISHDWSSSSCGRYPLCLIVSW